ncbi:MAG TPA: hypothetical protein VGI82_10095, partial [Chitinophagaceae bacterium]
MNSLAIFIDAMKQYAYTGELEFKNCSSSDVDAIFTLYDAAIDLQKQKKMVVWPKFERSLVEQEILEGRQ